MSFRSRSTLEAWILEFEQLGYPIVGSIKVMQQDGDGGADTGLVGVHLANAPTVTYIQPDDSDPQRWAVTLEARESTLVLDAAALMSLSTELAVASALCAFLQAKSASYRGIDQP